MTKKREISLEIRRQIVGMRKGGHSYLDIARILSLPKSTIQYIITQWAQCGNIKNKFAQGDPEHCSPGQ